MTEKATQGRVVAYARKKGCLAVKMTVGGGFPDYMFMYDGRILFIEFKATYGHLTHLQEFTHELLRKRNFRVHTIKNPEEGIDLIDNWMHNGQSGSGNS